MLQNLNFPGLCPGPRWELTAPPDSLANGEEAPALGPSGLVSTAVSGSDPLQSWQLH